MMLTDTYSISTRIGVSIGASIGVSTGVRCDTDRQIHTVSVLILKLIIYCIS